MEHNSPDFKNSAPSKVLLILNLIVTAFWVVGKTVDIYRYDIVGAIFEILWLGMLLGLFVLPVVSIVFFIREKFNLRSLYLYSLILAVGNIYLVIFLGK